MWMKQVKQHRRLLILLAIGSLAVMPGAVIAPVLPEIVQHLQIDRGLAGYLVSAHYLTVALFSPLLALLADRMGQVRILVGSAVCFALFGIAGTLTQSFLPMLVTRGLLGAATGGIAAASLGLLARMHSQEEARSQAIAYASTTLTLANIVYPLLSGWLGSTQWQLAFYLYGLGLPLAVLAAVILPDSTSKPAAGSFSLSMRGGGKLGSLCSNPKLVRLLITVGCSAAIAYATVIYVPLYLKATLNAATTINGLVLSFQAIGAAIVSAFGVKLLIKRMGAIPTIVLGLTLMTLALLTIPQLQQLQWLIPTVLVFGIGMGITITSHYATIANLAPLELQTVTLAVATSMNFLGQFFSPTLFGFALKLDGLPMVFYAAAAVATLTAAFLLLSRTPSPQK